MGKFFPSIRTHITINCNLENVLCWSPKLHWIRLSLQVIETPTHVPLLSRIDYIHCLLFSSLFRPNANKAYPLKLGKTIVPVYCHMTTLDGCGGGGWTLVMKMDGSKVNIKQYS